MRLAPVPLAYARRPNEAIERAEDSSRTTHAAPAAVDACRYLAALLVRALAGEPKDAILMAPAPEPLVPDIAAIAAGSFRGHDPAEIRASGYVVHTLGAAMWALEHSSTFEEGALLAVNLGEDADTTGAVYGQLAGAIYSKEGIPARWRERLAKRELIEDYAGRLLELAEAL